MSEETLRSKAMIEKKLRAFLEYGRPMQDKLLAFLDYADLQQYGHAEWLETPRLKVYLRSQRRVIKDEILLAMTIANVTANPTGQGTFTLFLQQLFVELHQRPRYQALVVEQVLTRRFARYFQRREGWERLPNDMPGAPPIPASFVFRLNRNDK